MQTPPRRTEQACLFPTTNSIPKFNYFPQFIGLFLIYLLTFSNSFSFLIIRSWYDLCHSNSFLPVQWIIFDDADLNDPIIVGNNWTFRRTKQASFPHTRTEQACLFPTTFSTCLFPTTIIPWTWSGMTIYSSNSTFLKWFGISFQHSSTISPILFNFTCTVQACLHPTVIFPKIFHHFPTIHRHKIIPLSRIIKPL